MSENTDDYLVNDLLAAEAREEAEHVAEKKDGWTVRVVHEGFARIHRGFYKTREEAEAWVRCYTVPYHAYAVEAVLVGNRIFIASNYLTKER